MEEEWLPIEGYEEDYMVSNLGEVVSFVLCKDGRILKPADDGRGYLQCVLCKNGKRRTHKIHTLVGEAFIGKRENELSYDHIDRNKINNRADNIRLATKTEQGINKNIAKNNSTGYKNIGKCVDNFGNEYYRIVIRRNKKAVVDRKLNIKKFTIEEVIKIRDEELAKLADLTRI